MRGVCLVDICVCTPWLGWCWAGAGLELGWCWAGARAVFALHLNIPPATNIICKLSKLDAENPELFM